MDLSCTIAGWPLFAKGDDCGEPQEGGREGEGGGRGREAGEGG